MTTAKFFPWPSIEGFHNVRKSTQKYPELYQNLENLRYRPKIKLHGTNAAIQCLNDGTVVAQSRSQLLVDGADNCGFAAWVKSTENSWSCLRDYIVFGEWCGPGVQGGVAACQIPNKIFAIFALYDLDQKIFCYEPEAIEIALGTFGKPSILPPQAYILPWADKEEIWVDWSESSENLVSVTEKINARVAMVEKCDPWILETFGISGVGEGLVYYPECDNHSQIDAFKVFGDLAFKAKGEQHKTINKQKPASVDPEVAKSADQFVTLVLTLARLEQGAITINGTENAYAKPLTGKFVDWILSDIQKECIDELEASNLTFEQVNKPLAAQARKWYLSKS